MLIDKDCQGLFLDLDGTLSDSIPVMRIVYNRFLNHFGKVGSNAEFAHLNGPPLPEIITYLANEHGLSQPKASLLQLYKNMIDEDYHDVLPNSGAYELLKSARNLGMTVGVVTSSSSSLALDWLQRVELATLVNIIIGGNDVTVGKPNPEPYLLALQRTGCKASASFAVEDSANGVQSALSAGIQTFMLSTSSDNSHHEVITINKLKDVEHYLLNEI